MKSEVQVEVEVAEKGIDMTDMVGRTESGGVGRRGCREGGGEAVDTEV